jgi:hypothetical protein
VLTSLLSVGSDEQHRYLSVAALLLTYVACPTRSQVDSIDASGMLLVSLDALHLDDGWLAASEVRVSQTDVLKAPEPTALKEYHRVRIAFDNEHVGGQVWQYGVIRYVHVRQARPPRLERYPTPSGACFDML